MFIVNESTKKFEEGIKEFMNDFGKGLVFADIELSYEEVKDNEVSLSFDGKKALIKGSKPIHFYRELAALMEHLKKNPKPFEAKETSYFNLFGNMIDCSRNSVIKVSMVKKYLRFMAASGMNMMMLYTEDTYEVEGYPYFGAFRGRYSTEELKEIDDYAAIFDIEVIPCIQTLAHLTTMLRWPVFDSIKDTSDILLVENEDTYKFVESEIKSVSGPLRSKRIHLGMDEAHYLGLGNYLLKNGYKDRQKLILAHLTKVQEICDKLGLETIIWSDMFFRVLSPTNAYYDIPEDTETFPFNFSDKCHLCFWDYYHKDYKMYEKFLRLHMTADKQTYFAGGGWTWGGMAPNYEKAFVTTEPGLQACKDTGVTNAFCTMWQDNGAETCHLVGMPSVLYFAQLGYLDGPVDMKVFSEKLEFLTGLPFESYKLMGDMEALPQRNYDNLTSTPCKYALYQDPMMGLYDAQIRGMDFGKFYEELTKKFDSLEVKNELTDYYRAFANTLAIKSELGIKITDAYLAKDKKALQKIVNEVIPECLRRVEETHILREKIWLEESKANGYEVQDIRYSALEGRLRAAIRRLNEYINGDIDSIPELEEERLPILPGEESTLVHANNWCQIVSANTI